MQKFNERYSKAKKEMYDGVMVREESYSEEELGMLRFEKTFEHLFDIDAVRDKNG